MLELPRGVGQTALVMNSITNLSPVQLRHAADIQERILALQQELNQLFGGEAEPTPDKRRLSPEGGAAIIAGAKARSAKPRDGRRKRRLSPEGLAAIRAGVAKRVAARAGQGAPSYPARKRNFSAAGRARLSALAKARWAKARKEGKSRL
jgi:hypothetical protein